MRGEARAPANQKALVCKNDQPDFGAANELCDPNKGAKRTIFAWRLRRGDPDLKEIVRFTLDI
jgi:hypothetical protein